MKNKIYVILFIISCIVILHQPAQAQTDAFEIGGHYKNFFVGSKSTATEEGLFADTNRLRLEMKKLADPWQFYLTIDNEVLINDFSNTSDFANIRSRSQNQLARLDWDKVSTDDDHLYVRHAIYRAYVKYYDPKYQVVVGKQAIDWGKLRFYSPMDIFNPIGAIDLERDVRPGIDAVNFNYSLSDFSGITLVAAPGRSHKDTQAGIRYYQTVQTYDVSAILATINEDLIAGFAFDGYLQNAGLRGEVTVTKKETGREFLRAGVGLDYNISEKFYISVEQFFNGGHDDNDVSAFLSSYQTSHDLLSLKKHLTSLWFKYRLNPLLELDNYLIYDWEGESVVFNPEARYNMSENTEAALGAQMFWGDANSEFGPYEHLVYAEFKWFF